MQKQFYFLSPVEVVKVTTQNLEEVAEWCDGKVATTVSRRVPGRMDSYVWVPTPKGTAISWAFPGMFITKRLVLTVKDEIRVTYAVFRKDYFEKNYFETPSAAVDQTWERAAKGEKVKRSTKALKPVPTEPKNHPQIVVVEQDGAVASMLKQEEHVLKREMEKAAQAAIEAEERILAAE